MSIELPPGTAAYSDRSPPPQNRQLLLLLAFFIGIVLAIFASVQGMVDVLVGWIPTRVEQQLGALIVPIYEQQAQPSAAQDALNQMLDHLESHLSSKSLSSEQQNRSYQVIYIPNATVNAIAIPGDRIILYQGLIDQAESENELMMVLGHELGHFAHRDHLRQLGRGILLQLVWAGLLGDLGSLQSIALSGATTLDNARFSQDQEYQADAFGLELLQQTYGQVVGATDFFARLSRQGTSFDFLSTHPGAEQRVQRLQALIQQQHYSIGTRSPLPTALNP